MDTTPKPDEPTEHGTTQEGADAEPTGTPNSDRHRSETHPVTPPAVK